MSDGIPSPSPEFPQQIKNVTGNANIKIQNKNLVNNDFTKWTNGVYAYIPIQLKQGQAYTLSAERVGELKTKYYNFGIVKDGTAYPFVGLRTIIEYETGNPLSDYTFTPDDTWTNPKLVCYIASSETRFNELFQNYNIQLEQGTTATSYVSHQEQNLPFTLGNIELCEIGTVKDYFYKDNRKWFLHKEIGKKLIENDVNVIGFNTTSYAIPKFEIDKSYIGIEAGWNRISMRSDKWHETAYSNPTSGGFDTGAAKNQIAFWADGIESITDAKELLVGSIFYYPIITPTNTEITETTLIEQLEATLQAKSYNDQTNISQTNDELPFILDIEALKNN